MRLLDNFNAKPQRYNINIMDRTFDILGISLKNVQEFTSKNIKNFNEVALDDPKVDYFSVGSQKEYLTVADQLKHAHDTISEGLITNRSDGMVRPEEAQWGEYLITFNQDHLEMVGFNAEYNPQYVYNLITNNIKLCEVKNDPKEAYNYGVEYLFQQAPRRERKPNVWTL